MASFQYFAGRAGDFEQEIRLSENSTVNGDSLVIDSYILNLEDGTWQFPCALRFSAFSYPSAQRIDVVG